MADIVERLREEALALQQTAWSRMDGGQQCSLNASLAEEAADEIERLQRELSTARRTALLEAAEIAKEFHFMKDIDWWLNSTKKEISAETCLLLAAALRAKAEEA